MFPAVKNLAGRPPALTGLVGRADAPEEEDAGDGPKNVKCFVEGSEYGITVDLNKFNSCTALQDSLLNKLGGKNVIYQDSEGDMILLCDEQWDYFCSRARRLFIKH